MLIFVFFTKLAFPSYLFSENLHQSAHIEKKNTKMWYFIIHQLKIVKRRAKKYGILFAIIKVHELS